MKAYINDLGQLIIRGESQLEKFALDCWYNKHEDDCIIERCEGGEADLVINSVRDDANENTQNPFIKESE